jgi:hypothetical protein
LGKYVFIFNRSKGAEKISNFETKSTRHFKAFTSTNHAVRQRTHLNVMTTTNSLENHLFFGGAIRELTAGLLKNQKYGRESAKK